MIESFEQLKGSIEGEVFCDDVMRVLYATDASPYQETPLAVLRPKNEEDIKKIIEFANLEKISLIPRTAGTSLAGQCVGNGAVVDVSKYMTEIIELNTEEKWIRLQPGVIRDDLNKYLAPHKLFFGPETSTSNRCMIGGMVGNNACGAHSLIYGSTREHVLELKGFLSDGSQVVFKSLSKSEFESKCLQDDLEGKIYKQINSIFSNAEILQEIKDKFPKFSIERRNTGYALDILMNSIPFTTGAEDFNFSKLICGSEGTLAFITEIKLNLVDTPPVHKGLIAAHFNTVDEALRANLIALKHKPGAIELIDKIILDCTKENMEQMKNRFFIEGDPGAVLIIEFERDTKEEIDQIAKELIAELKAAGYGYSYPQIYAGDINKVWDLRKAGLGLLSNMVGDGRPVSFIEDTAVDVNDLPEYILEFNELLKKYDLSCVYHAHAATGELHLRPILNLKDKTDVTLFHQIGEEVAHLVKKYNGSLSGEHGDGRLRGEFIKIMVGERINQIFKDVKACWDPNHLLNPGKIVDTPKMNEFLRYAPGQETRQFETVFNFDAEGGILRAAEKCNGSGDCRKSPISGGTMCPSYMATKDEKSTTRARANILRNFLTKSDKDNVFSHKEIYEVMDLCLSCKGCKSECPSNVDVAKLKAEFLHQYYKTHGVPLRAKMFANVTRTNKLQSLFPRTSRFFMQNNLTGSIIKNILKVSAHRQLPTVSNMTIQKWATKFPDQLKSSKSIGKVIFFNDEFSNYLDADIGIKAIRLLVRLGYDVELVKHLESGRSWLSKGLLDKAKELAEGNVRILSDYVSNEVPLVGLEPSAIYTFKDEYPNLVNAGLKEKADYIAKHSFMIDEFLANEAKAGRINNSQFTSKSQNIHLHGHCHQKALGSVNKTKDILELPANFKVNVIPSGCCGMAGSFGYEEEHYDVSMQVGNLVLFPAVKKANADDIIAAPGTSCRHQIKDGTNRIALHPVEILYNALL